MALFQDDAMRLSDDDSYVMVDVKDFYYSATDSEKDSSSVKSQPDSTETESSDFDAVYDVSDMFKRFQFETGASQKVDDDVIEFPAHIKRKEHMEIKDVVKDHALPFLPAKSLARFRAVSKDWDQWIASPFLAHKQSYSFREISGFFCQDRYGDPTFVTLNQTAYGIPSPSLGFLPECVVIQNSCNGMLLCQGLSGENSYYICNPVNKEWKVLPQPNYYHGSEPSIVLVFEPAVLNIAAHFQLVCAVPVVDLPIVYFEVYSSETKCWKQSVVACIELGASRLKDNGFYMKGVAYWETETGEVLAFDLKNEIYAILPLPADTAPHGVLTQMHGELCYIHAHNQAGNVCIIDVYNGINMNMRHSINIDIGLVGSVTQDCRVLPCVKSDIVMILVGGVVYSYHLRHGKVVAVSRRGNDSRARYFPYVNSLVSLACN